MKTDKERIDFIQSLVDNDMGFEVINYVDYVEVFTENAQFQEGKTVRDAIDKAMEFGTDPEGDDE